MVLGPVGGGRLGGRCPKDRPPPSPAPATFPYWQGPPGPAKAVPLLMDAVHLACLLFQKVGPRLSPDPNNPKRQGLRLEWVMGRYDQGRVSRKERGCFLPGFSGPNPGECTTTQKKFIGGGGGGAPFGDPQSAPPGISCGLMCDFWGRRLGFEPPYGQVCRSERIKTKAGSEIMIL